MESSADDYYEDDAPDDAPDDDISSDISVGTSASQIPSPSKSQLSNDLKSKQGAKNKKTIKEFFIVDSPFAGTENELIQLAISTEVISEYRCYGEHCKVVKTWHRKPITLILARKNNTSKDLTPSNLELLCPNCFCSIYGKSLPASMIPIRIICQICGFDISKFGKKYTISRTCKMCEKKSVNQFEDKLIENYEEELAKYCPNGLLPNMDTTLTTSKTTKTKAPKVKSAKKDSEKSAPVVKINLGFSMNLEEIMGMDDRV